MAKDGYEDVIISLLNTLLPITKRLLQAQAETESAERLASLAAAHKALGGEDAQQRVVKLIKAQLDNMESALERKRKENELAAAEALADKLKRASALLEPEPKN